jgi:hypothetical protein
MQHSQLLFNLENQTNDFSYIIFPVRKNKYWKNFKIMRKSLFNYSLYSHPELEISVCDTIPPYSLLVRQLRLIVYHHNFHLWYMVIYIGGMSVIGVLLKFYLGGLNEIYDLLISLG